MQFKRTANEPFNESEAYSDMTTNQGEDLYRAQSTTDSEQGRARPVRESVIDANSTFDGKFETEQDLRVEGTVSGELVCRGLLTIEGGANASAKIEARDAHIRGRMEGEITCSGRLELAPTAVVTGTLRSALLVIHEGASVNGTIETRAAAPPSKAEARLAAVRSEPEEQISSVPDNGRERNGRGRPVPTFALSSSEPDRASRGN